MKTVSLNIQDIHRLFPVGSHVVYTSRTGVIRNTIVKSEPRVLLNGGVVIQVYGVCGEVDISAIKARYPITVKDN